MFYIGLVLRVAAAATFKNPVIKYLLSCFSIHVTESVFRVSRRLRLVPSSLVARHPGDLMTRNLVNYEFCKPTLKAKVTGLLLTG